jgi:UPF0755 protein
MKRALQLGAVLAVIALVVTAYYGARFQKFLAVPLNVPTSGSEFEIEPGMSFGEVSAALEANGIVSDAEMLRFYARWQGIAGSVQAGQYLIREGTTPAALLEQFTSGDVQLYSFTIVEGWNRYDLLRALHGAENVTAEMTDEDWPVLLEELGAQTRVPEGLFLPETYRFARGTSDRDLLRQAYRQMQATLSEEWAGRAEDAPVTSPYEALILASIVEKETARADEREQIAGVFARRLAKRMRLQTDPTVIYGIGPSFNGNLTRKDLRTDTPYNTYTRHGLPPTPIAMPGRAAIYAALHPAAGDTIYFVATGLPDGSHKFSRNKAEHDAAVQEYLQRLRQRRTRN